MSVPIHSVAALDRLRPRITHRVGSGQGQCSRVQTRAKKVLRKYRKQERYTHLRRLREMIPTLAQKEDPDEVRRNSVFRGVHERYIR